MQLYFLIRELCSLDNVVYLITTPSDTDAFAEKIPGLHVIEVPNCPPGKYSTTYFRESAKLVEGLADRMDLLYYLSGGGGCMNHEIVPGSVIDVFKHRLPSVITLHNGCRGQDAHFVEMFKRVNGVVFSHKEALFSTRNLRHAHVNKVLIPTSTDCDYSALHDIRGTYDISDQSIITFVASKISLKSKGFDLFVKIITELNDDTFAFLIVGSCAESIVDQYKRKNVIFTGKIGNNEVKNILFSSDYYLTPTDWKTKGFDGTISEALLSGTRVVATRSEIGEQTLKADNKSLWYFDKNEYVEKTVDLILNNQAVRDPQNSIDLAKHFSTRTTMKKYLYFFQLTVDSWQREEDSFQ